VDIAIRMNIRASNAIRYSVTDTKEVHFRMSACMDTYIEDKQQGKIRKDFIDNENENR